MPSAELRLAKRSENALTDVESLTTELNSLRDYRNVLHDAMKNLVAQAAGKLPAAEVPELVEALERVAAELSALGGTARIDELSATVEAQRGELETLRAAADESRSRAETSARELAEAEAARAEADRQREAAAGQATEAARARRVAETAATEARAITHTHPRGRLAPHSTGRPAGRPRAEPAVVEARSRLEWWAAPRVRRVSTGLRISLRLVAVPSSRGRCAKTSW
jgi:hypothetical protein